MFLSLPYLPLFLKKCIIKALAAAPSCRKGYLVVNNSKICCACLSAPEKKEAACVLVCTGELYGNVSVRKKKMLLFSSLAFFGVCLLMRPYCCLLS